MANIEDIKKLASEKGIELTEEMLEAINGGISQEEWDKLTPDEQKRAQIMSLIQMSQNLHCYLED